jgi:hypothetical protein
VIDGIDEKLLPVAVMPDAFMISGSWKKKKVVIIPLFDIGTMLNSFPTMEIVDPRLIVTARRHVINCVLVEMLEIALSIRSLWPKM